jgi:hypothetical protein
VHRRVEGTPTGCLLSVTKGFGYFIVNSVYGLACAMVRCGIRIHPSSPGTSLMHSCMVYLVGFWYTMLITIFTNITPVNSMLAAGVRYLLIHVRC